MVVSPAASDGSVDSAEVEASSEDSDGSVVSVDSAEVEASSEDSDGSVVVDSAEGSVVFSAVVSEVASVLVSVLDSVVVSAGSSEATFLPLSMSAHFWPAGALTAASADADSEIPDRVSSISFC